MKWNAIVHDIRLIFQLTAGYAVFIMLQAELLYRTFKACPSNIHNSGIVYMQYSTQLLSLVLPLHHAGEGECVEESGDTAIQFVVLVTDLNIPMRLLHTRGNNFVM